MPTADIVPARPLTTDDVDAIIATRQTVEAAFWRALTAVRKGGEVSTNEIARRVHAAGIASRPTVLERLRAEAISDLPATVAELVDAYRTASAATSRAADSLAAFAAAIKTDVAQD